MALNKFVNSGTDESILKSMEGDSVHVDQEILSKAMNKSGLVQKEVQVKGKNGQIFTRKQWVKAGEDQPVQKPVGKQDDNSVIQDAVEQQKEIHKLVDYMESQSDDYGYHGDAKYPNRFQEILDNAKAGTSYKFMFNQRTKSYYIYTKNDDGSWSVSVEYYEMKDGILGKDKIVKKGGTYKNSKAVNPKIYYDAYNRKSNDIPVSTNSSDTKQGTSQKDQLAQKPAVKQGEKSNNSSAKYKPSDFQFKAGGQDVADFINSVDEEIGIKKHTNGNVGFGELKLNNGETVLFGYDNTSPFVTWGGLRYRDAKELKDKMSGRKSLVESGKKTDEANTKKPSLADIQGYGYDSSNITGDPTLLKIGGREYYKIGNNKWQYSPSSSHAIGGIYTDAQIFDKVYNTSEKIEIMPSNKNNGNSGLTTIDYNGETIRKVQRTIKGETKDYYRVDGSRTLYEDIEDAKKEIDEMPGKPVGGAVKDKDGNIHINLPPQSNGKKLSKDDAKKKTQSITSSIGKDDKSRNDFMAKAKSQGITWKEDNHAGINWMRCCMAMNKYFAEGGSFRDSINETPKKTVIDGKTFNVKDINGQPTIEISMYDTQKRLDKVKKFAKENGIKIHYTH